MSWNTRKNFSFKNLFLFRLFFLHFLLLCWIFCRRVQSVRCGCAERHTKIYIYFSSAAEILNCFLKKSVNQYTTRFLYVKKLNILWILWEKKNIKKFSDLYNRAVNLWFQIKKSFRKNSRRRKTTCDFVTSAIKDDFVFVAEKYLYKKKSFLKQKNIKFIQKIKRRWTGFTTFYRFYYRFD